MTAPPIRGMVLDLDGLLIDSEAWSWRAHDAALARYGLAPLSLQEVRTLVGMHAAGEWQALRRLRPALPDDAHRAYGEAQGEAFVALRDRSLAPLPGVHELLAAARELGLRVGLASNSPLAHLDAVLEGLGIRANFDALASGDEVPHGKPDPGVYLLALARLGLEAPEALAAEDSALGMTAARAAGLFCAVVPSEITAGQDFTAADARFADLLALAAWLPGFVAERCRA